MNGVLGICTRVCWMKHGLMMPALVWRQDDGRIRVGRMVLLENDHFDWKLIPVVQPDLLRMKFMFSNTLVVRSIARLDKR